jgi:hypothetical protein
MMLLLLLATLVCKALFGGPQMEREREREREASRQLVGASWGLVWVRSTRSTITTTTRLGLLGLPSSLCFPSEFLLHPTKLSSPLQSCCYTFPPMRPCCHWNSCSLELWTRLPEVVATTAEPH